MTRRYGLYDAKDLVWQVSIPMIRSVLYGCVSGGLVSLFLFALVAAQSACGFCVPSKLSWFASLLTMALSAFVGAFKSRRMLSALTWVVSFVATVVLISLLGDSVTSAYRGVPMQLEFHRYGSVLVAVVCGAGCLGGVLASRFWK